MVKTKRAGILTKIVVLGLLVYFATVLLSLNSQIAAAEAERAAAAADPFVAEILAAIDARKAAKKEKNFAEADRIRDELAAKGVTLIDTPQGTTYKIN